MAESDGASLTGQLPAPSPPTPGRGPDETGPEKANDPGPETKDKETRAAASVWRHGAGKKGCGSYMRSWTKSVVKLFAGAALALGTFGGTAALAGDERASSSRWREGSDFGRRTESREEYRGGRRDRYDRDRDYGYNDEDYGRGYGRGGRGDHHCETYVVVYSLHCEQSHRAHCRRDAIDLTKALRRYGADAHRHGNTVHYEMDCEKRVTVTDHEAAHELEEWLEDLGFEATVVED